MTVGMVRLIANLFLEGAVVYAFCHLLDMRSNRVFAFVSMLGMVASLVLDELGLPVIVRILLAGPLLILGFPILYSRGPLRARVTRAFVIITCVILTEYIGNFIQSAFIGLNTIPDLHGTDIADISLLYAIMLPIVIILLQTVIIAFNSADQYRDTTFGLPIVALLFWTYIITLLASFHFTVEGLGNTSLPLVLLLYTLLAFAIGLATLELTRKTAQSHREATNLEAAIQHDEHVREEIESLVNRSMEVRRLRHDLANQMNVVCELAEKDHADEAIVYLNRLQERAHYIAHSANGEASEEQ